MFPDLSVIARVLTPMLTPAVGQIGKHLIGEEIIERRKLNETALQPILTKAAEEVSETIEPFEPADIDQICLFITSAEAEAIVRQIYAAKISQSQQQSWEQIKTAFLKSFSLYTGIPEDRLQHAAIRIFEILIAGCEEALQEAIDQGKLSAHEARSQFRHLLLYDEIAAVQNKIDLLVTLQKPNLEEILQFEQKYRQAVGDREGYITPPYLSEARKLPIDEVYVSPNFTAIPRRRDEQREKLTLDDFSQRIYRTVLLGNPGGGKSTLTKRLCHDLAKRYSDRLLAGRQLTPILVILREYGSQKKNKDSSILQFIETIANSKYQVHPPAKAFEYLLLNGRAAVIFDGLDELTDTSYRKEISDDVESFCNLYPAVPVLVTSREVGYKEAPLDERRFDLFHLTDFKDEQVSEYVQKWFAVDPDLTEEDKKQKGEAFLTESETVSDLRCNPLMLGLMCNIYRGAGYIPKNRPDVYEKCAEMMFERWDKSRGILVPQPIKEIESQVRPTMMYLAHWIYTHEKLQGGVTERKLIEKAADYLCDRRFEDQDEAELAAREFIYFCRGRAWVFTDVGTTKEGENLYQFTHRTFLEYFTASYLVRCHRTPEELLQILLPRIQKEEWDVVAQLAFQLQNKKIEEAGDELLTSILNKIADTEENEGLNLLDFAARCLQFMVPSPQVTRNITATYCEWLINRHIKYWDELSLYEILYPLLEVARENIGFVKSAIESCLKETIINLRDGVFDAIEILYFLSEEIRDKYWEESFKCLLDKHPEKIPLLCQNDLLICLYIYWLEKIDFESLLKWHGIQAIFTEFGFDSCSVGRLSLDYLLIKAILEDPDHHLVGNLETTENLSLKLRKVGQLAISNPQHPYRFISPRYRFCSQILLSLSHVEQENLRPQMLDINPEFIFGSFIILATGIEGDDKHNLLQKKGGIEHIINSKIAFFDYLRWTFIARLDRTATDKVQPELDRCGFTPEQQAFIWQWVRGEIDFVAIESPEETVDESDFAEV